MLFLYDILYGEKDLPEGAIPHLPNVDEKNRASLHTILCKYRDVFPWMLPTRATPNRTLIDVYEIPLEEGAEPVQKSMY